MTNGSIQVEIPTEIWRRLEPIVRRLKKHPQHRLLLLTRDVAALILPVVQRLNEAARDEGVQTRLRAKEDRDSSSPSPARAGGAPARAGGAPARAGDSPVTAQAPARAGDSPVAAQAPARAGGETGAAQAPAREKRSVLSLHERHADVAALIDDFVSRVQTPVSTNVSLHVTSQNFPSFAIFRRGDRLAWEWRTERAPNSLPIEIKDKVVLALVVRGGTDIDMLMDGSIKVHERHMQRLLSTLQNIHFQESAGAKAQ